MKITIDISDYEYEWINNAYNIPEELRVLIAERIINGSFKDKWIPCSVAMPEKYGEYQITWTTSVSKNRLIGAAEYDLSMEYDHDNNRFKGEWILDEYIKAYPDVKVIAWRELPEPYRGEQDAKNLLL